MVNPENLNVKVLQSEKGLNAFWGWLVLAAGTLGMMLTLPGRTAAISVFLDPLLTDLHLSRATASTLFMGGTLGYAAALPFMGRLLDRYDPRVCVTWTTVLFAIACFGMSFVVGPLSLLLGFLAIRSLGQGALLLVSQHTINLWFIRRRGFALGLAGAGIAIANAVFPLLISQGIAQIGWRATYIALGVLLLVVMLPVGAVFFRGHPEEHGMLPDCDPEEMNEEHWTRGEAVRSPTFWIFSSSILVLAGLSTALVFHHFSIMAANGLDRAAAAGFFVSLGLFTALSNVGSGIAMDRIGPRRVLLAGLVVQGTAVVLAGYATDTLMLWVYGSCQGVAAGVLATLTSAVWSHYYGRRHIGGIKGIAQMLFVTGTALGPLPFALCMDLAGSYMLAFQGSLALIMILSVATILVQPHRRRNLGQPSEASLVVPPNTSNLAVTERE